MKPYYQDDYVTLYHGDYRDHLADIPRADAVITDPPYGETSLGWDRWVTDWPDDASRIADALWCFGSMRMFFDRLTQFTQWKFSHEVVWEKHNGSGFAADKFRRVHEFATLWYRGEWGDLRHEVPKVPGAVKRTVRRKQRPPHTGEIAGTRYTSVDGGDLLQRSVLKVRSEHGRAIHPTQKPAGIVAPLIEYSVPPGGLVVDFFAGSGTTGVVARDMGRRSILFEVQERFAEKAAQRLSQQSFDFAAL